MSFSSISLCSKALVKIGAMPIASFVEESAEARVANQLYDNVCRSLLASYPWRFALSQKKLNRLDETPVADYRYAYQIPADVLRIISAGTGLRGKGISYRVYQNQLHTDADSVVLTYIARLNEAYFPDFFVEVLVNHLAVAFCLPLTESTNRLEYMTKLAADSLRTAKLIDSQQSVPSSFQDFSLIEVRG